MNEKLVAIMTIMEHMNLTIKLIRHNNQVYYVMQSNQYINFEEN